MKGKVQTNDRGTNVLVETDDSNDRHYHYSDFKVEYGVLTDEEIETAFYQKFGKPTIKMMKNELSKVEGFAHSNVQGSIVTHGSLVAYIRL